MSQPEHPTDREVGAFEAKTHLSRLLEEVAQGAQITITKHGQPIARLIPIKGGKKSTAAEAIEKIIELSKGNSLEGLDWKALRDEGRRF
ncbi:MAG: type II toxin-antitoxin system Phd/YefM family antitoxin [Candidatus Melainabacteria bacterium]